MKMIYHANINQKESEMAMLLTDKVDFRGKKRSEIERNNSI